MLLLVLNRNCRSPVELCANENAEQIGGLLGGEEFDWEAR